MQCFAKAPFPIGFSMFHHSSFCCSSPVMMGPSTQVQSTSECCFVAHEPALGAPSCEDPTLTAARACSFTPWVDSSPQVKLLFLVVYVRFCCFNTSVQGSQAYGRPGSQDMEAFLLTSRYHGESCSPYQDPRALSIHHHFNVLLFIFYFKAIYRTEGCTHTVRVLLLHFLPCVHLPAQSAQKVPRYRLGINQLPHAGLDSWPGLRCTASEEAETSVEMGLFWPKVFRAHELRVLDN